IRLSDVALRRPSLDEVFLALTDPGAATPASSPKPADEPA
ncbi:MAG: daunorubicin/doxorubicin resistance ABC transporter ATP-binding protein DrrA, partial [Actinomycetota bacterium]|nr:daunorubicin/doxorubicin resistance ABC transporter ATP-binding protein DrrA [Actinomycetota bacterium]